MKKVISFVLVLICITSMLCACGPVYQNSISPQNQPMTKWVADGFELYITDTDKGLMICDFAEKTIAYDVAFMPGNEMLLMDRRPQDVIWEDNVLYGDHGYENPGYSIAGGAYVSTSKTVFRVELDGHYIKTSDFPEKLVYRRVAENIKAEDIPVIEIDANFGYCPIYSIGSLWASEDKNVLIEIDGQLEPYGSYAIGKVTVNEQAENIYMAFNEINSTAYMGPLKDPNAIGTVYDTALATDEWKCEFFEDYFKATVVRSDYYEDGTVLVFHISE